MDTEKQKAFLLNFVIRLYSELGAHIAFLEWVKCLAPGEDIESILAQCRADPALKAYVDAFRKDLSAQLDESAGLDSDQAYREFLLRWIPTGKVN